MRRPMPKIQEPANPHKAAGHSAGTIVMSLCHAAMRDPHPATTCQPAPAITQRPNRTFVFNPPIVRAMTNKNIEPAPTSASEPASQAHRICSSLSMNAATIANTPPHCRPTIIRVRDGAASGRPVSRGTTWHAMPITNSPTNPNTCTNACAVADDAGMPPKYGVVSRARLNIPSVAPKVRVSAIETSRNGT